MKRTTQLYWLALPMVFLTACSEAEIFAPDSGAAARAALMTCTVEVRSATMTCKPVEIVQPAGIQADKIIGGQDTYVKLSNTTTVYDPDTDILQAEVTLQNLLQSVIGTTDGLGVTGVRVFFTAAPVASPSGSVTVANPDGTDAITGPAQPYFQYNQILQPYEISSAKVWQFIVTDEVATFTFRVMVAATMVDESAPLLDAVWTGTVDTDWFNAGNWQNNAVPGSTNVVAVPSDALLASPNNPVLNANASVKYLRVGVGSTLGLAGFEVEVSGNVDAPGAISGGSLLMSGSGTKLSGNVPSLRVTGSVSLQSAVTSTGPISIVDGSLTVADRALTIAIP